MRSPCGRRALIFARRCRSRNASLRKSRPDEGLAGPVPNALLAPALDIYDQVIKPCQPLDFAWLLADTATGGRRVAGRDQKGGSRADAGGGREPKPAL